MSFSVAISTCLSKYATFSGRAGRSEFWWFYLFCVLMSWGGTLVGHQIGVGDLLSHVVNLAFFIPTLAASSRRLHDTGRSGWWILLLITVIGLIPLVIWWATRSSAHSNKYGNTVSLYHFNRTPNRSRMEHQELPKIPLKTKTLIAAVGAILHVVRNAWSPKFLFLLTISVE